MAKSTAKPNAGGSSRKPDAKRAPRIRANPGDFLDLPDAASDYGTAAVVVLPMPLEASVSYGGGTARGPEAIIEASRQVELYSIGLDCEPALSYGIHTLPAPAAFSGPGRQRPADLVDAIAVEAERHLKAGKFVLGLGGEHTASLGIARAVAAVEKRFTLVHLDAHADLRDTYEDDPLSHACVVRRIAELPQCEAVLQLGIRSTSPDQVDFARGHARRGGPPPMIRTWYADAMHRSDDWRREFRKAVKGRRVFFTFDVDALDPAIVPATGTPEPNGLVWRQLMRAADITARHAKRCVAMDCVELAPMAGLHHADFTVARALYEMLTMFVTGR